MLQGLTAYPRLSDFEPKWPEQLTQTLGLFPSLPDLLHAAQCRLYSPAPNKDRDPSRSAGVQQSDASVRYSFQRIRKRRGATSYVKKLLPADTSQRYFFDSVHTPCRPLGLSVVQLGG
eukprot:GHVT01061944.1.p3 GENE.GHVT01061944.1~~GHVT01061944.1.p3  ORF type:complete len:118 (-),score=8.87 GHVT01061944.1:3502-3855(-)